MIFRRRATRTLAVDVGTSHVKIAEVDHSREAPRLRKLGLRGLVNGGRPVGGGVAATGGASEPVAALRKLLGGAGPARRRVVCCVGGRDVIVKAVRMERMSEDESARAIRWEAARHVPFDLDAVELDFHVVDPDGRGSRMTVLLAAARRPVVEERVRLLEEAGLEPSVVDAEPLALHNCLEHNHPEAMQGVVGLAAVGHGHTAFNVSYDGTPVLARSVPFGTAALRRELIERRGIGPERAEAFLRGREERPPRPALRTIRRRAGMLAEAVERTSAFLEERSPGLRLGMLYLCGGGARLLRLQELLADRLGVEVRTANPLQVLGAEPGALDGVDAEATLPLFAGAVGMALRRSG